MILRPRSTFFMKKRKRLVFFFSAYVTMCCISIHGKDSPSGDYRNYKVVTKNYEKILL